MTPYMALYNHTLVNNPNRTNTITYTCNDGHNYKLVSPMHVA